MATFKTVPHVSAHRGPDGAWELALKRGQVVLLLAEGETAPPVIAPVAPQGPLNSYGLP
jgi:hypothetical protein